MHAKQLPEIIQGGMGVAVSDWRLARTVAEQGLLGAASSTGLDTVLARRLELGDPDGHLRRALEGFPWSDMAERVQTAYYRPGGKAPAGASPCSGCCPCWRRS